MEVFMEIYSVNVCLADSAGEATVEFDFGDQTRVLFYPNSRGRLLLEHVARMCLLDWINEKDSEPTRTLKAA
jgi:hypothetical protein